VECSKYKINFIYCRRIGTALPTAPILTKLATVQRHEVQICCMECRPLPLRNVEITDSCKVVPLAEPVFTKLAPAPEYFVRNSSTRFHENPTTVQPPMRADMLSPHSFCFTPQTLPNQRSTEHTFLITQTRAVKQQRLACSLDVSSSNLGQDIN
jgi:hypothetical protein